jgi:CHAT domain-containing protein
MNRVGLTALGLSVALQVTMPVLRVNAEESPIIAQTPQTQSDRRLQEANDLLNQASTLNDRGRYQEAIPLAEQALELLEAVLPADDPDVAVALAWVAYLYQAQGRYSEAEPLYKRSLLIIEQQLGADHPFTAQSLNNLAYLYQEQGRYSEAEPLCKRSLSIYEQQLGADHPFTATSLNNLAELYREQGRYSEAEPLYKLSLLIREQQLGAYHPYTAQSLNNLALLYQEQGRYSEAEPLYKLSLLIREQQLGADHPDTAQSLNNLAELYREQGRYSEAEPLLKRSLLIHEQQLGADHPLTATSLNNLAVLNWVQEQFDQSLSFWARGLEVEETNILQNVATLTEAQQRDYLQTLSYSLDTIVTLHLRDLPDNPQASATALTTILRRKGRILDTLSNSLQRIRANARPEDLARLNQISQLHTQLTNLLNQGTTREQVQAIQSQIDNLQKQLAQNNPEFNPEPVTLEAIRSLLPKNAALIEFFQYQPFNPTAAPSERYGEPHYAAYILTPQGDPVGIDLGEAQFIDTHLGLFRQQLLDPSFTRRLQQTSQQVYQILIEPLKPYLGSSQHLLLSPDGNLNLIPFAALQDSTGQYLLEQYQLTALSSGRDLVTYQRTYEAAQPPVIVANPSYNASSDATAPQLVTTALTRGITLARPGTGTPTPQLKESSLGELQALGIPFPWDDLPGTKREVELIAPKLPLSLTLTEEKATERAVKTVQSPSILHFATHGFFLPSGSKDQNPLVRSGLILAGANLQDVRQNQGEDGVLTALEVSGLDLRGTSLVVMSACDTGKGEVQNGEGVYGLRRAFTLAGAASQLFSLWPVNDWATQALLTRYYDYILEGRGRSDAWRQTQLDMLRGNLDGAIDPQGRQTITDTAHPNYWAAFVPSGNWEPMELK